MSKITKGDAMKELAKREISKRLFSQYVPYIFPAYVEEDYNKKFFEKLQDVVEGRTKKLMVFMPPRSMKSEAIAKLLPSWMLGKMPEKNIVCASYGSDLAVKHGRECKNITQDQKFKNVFPDFKLADDKREGGNWETKQGGGYYSVGVGGALTGRGFDCICEGEKILTDKGKITIDILAQSVYNYRVLSYNHATNEPEFKSVIASKKKKRRKVFRVVTGSGNELKVTRDHKFYVVGQGYKTLESCKEGEQVIIYRDRNNMRDVFKKEDEESVRGQKGFKERAKGFLLQLGLLKGSSCSKESQNVFKVWREADYNKAWEILRRMQGGVQAIKVYFGKYRMLNVFKRSEAVESSNAVLFYGMQERASFSRDEGGSQFELETRKRSADRVQGNPTGYFKQGWKRLCCLFKERFFMCSSQGQEYKKQFNAEFDNGLQFVSCNSSQVKIDTIQDIIAVEGVYNVYDIQVQDNNNFFAENILVHNCGIIDDPVKNREDAESITMREKVWDWYTSTFLTRRQGQNSAIIILMTRWHTDDLAGRLLDHEPGEWDVLCMPAIDSDGVALVKNREGYGIGFYETMKESIGVKDFEALYQQDPIAGSGNIFKKEDIRYFAMSDIKPEEYTLAIHVDPAFSSRDESDDTAIVVTARHKITKEIYVVDVFGAPLLPSQAYSYIVSLAEKWRGYGFTLDFISIEKVDLSKAQGEFLKGFDNYMRENGKFYTVLHYKPQGKGKKEDRIKFSLEPMFNRGAIYFRCDDSTNKDWMKLEQQLLKFPVGTHDDLPDALSQGVSVWEDRGNSNQTGVSAAQKFYGGMDRRQSGVSVAKNFYS